MVLGSELSRQLNEPVIKRARGAYDPDRYWANREARRAYMREYRKRNHARLTALSQERDRLPSRRAKRAAWAKTSPKRRAWTPLYQQKRRLMAALANTPEALREMRTVLFEFHSALVKKGIGKS